MHFHLSVSSFLIVYEHNLSWILIDIREIKYYEFLVCINIIIVSFKWIWSNKSEAICILTYLHDNNLNLRLFNRNHCYKKLI